MMMTMNADTDTTIMAMTMSADTDITITAMTTSADVDIIMTTSADTDITITGTTTSAETDIIITAMTMSADADIIMTKSIMSIIMTRTAYAAVDITITMLTRYSAAGGRKPRYVFLMIKSEIFLKALNRRLITGWCFEPKV